MNISLFIHFFQVAIPLYILLTVGEVTRNITVLLKVKIKMRFTSDVHINGFHAVERCKHLVTYVTFLFTGMLSRHDYHMTVRNAVGSFDFRLFDHIQVCVNSLFICYDYPF